MSELNSKALSPPAPVHFKEVNMFLTGGQGTYFPLSQTLHSQSDHQAILRCQNIIQTRIMSLHYVRLLNDVSFSSQLSDLFLLTTPSCHSSPLHTNGCSELLCRKDCSSYQESKTHIMVCQRALPLPNYLETSGTLLCSRQTCPLKYFGQKP